YGRVCLLLPLTVPWWWRYVIRCSVSSSRWGVRDSSARAPTFKRLCPYHFSVLRAHYPPRGPVLARHEAAGDGVWAPYTCLTSYLPTHNWTGLFGQTRTTRLPLSKPSTVSIANAGIHPTLPPRG